MIKKILKNTVLFDLYNAYKLHRFQIDWRKHNGENDTTANKIYLTLILLMLEGLPMES